jgi:hypothetical protein
MGYKLAVKILRGCRRFLQASRLRSDRVTFAEALSRRSPNRRGQ